MALGFWCWDLRVEHKTMFGCVSEAWSGTPWNFLAGRMGPCRHDLKLRWHLFAPLPVILPAFAEGEVSVSWGCYDRAGSCFTKGWCPLWTGGLRRDQVWGEVGIQGLRHTVSDSFVLILTGFCDLWGCRSVFLQDRMAPPWWGSVTPIPRCDAGELCSYIFDW